MFDSFPVGTPVRFLSQGNDEVLTGVVDDRRADRIGVSSADVTYWIHWLNVAPIELPVGAVVHTRDELADETMRDSDIPVAVGTVTGDVVAYVMDESAAPGHPEEAEPVLCGRPGPGWVPVSWDQMGGEVLWERLSDLVLSDLVSV